MKRRLLYLLFSIIFLVSWEYFSKQHQNVRLLISSPLLTLDYFRLNSAALMKDMLVTLSEAAIGLTIAIFFSFTMMLVCFYKPKMMNYILPAMVASQVIPLIVLAPFFVILLGFGIGSKIAMAAVISFFPVFVNFAHGFKSISNNIHELMYIYNTPLKNRIRYVYFPLSLPSIIAGFKISATLSVIGAIVGEFSGTDSGIGRNLYISAIRLEPDLMMCSLILSVIMGTMIYSVFLLMERKFLKWL
jgi:ABC-type nitrate/sulfonate/bicarbonate transport system permease component